MENQPIILFMEWSKNPKLVSSQETHDIETITAPDETSLKLREEVDILKLKLEDLRNQKEDLIHQLNRVNDSAAIARSTCEGLDELCEAIKDRMSATSEALARETKVCAELISRITRDKNKAIIGELALRVESLDPSIMEYISNKISQSTEPDDLIQRLTIYQDYHHRRMKDAQRLVAQLRTTVQSLKKEVEESERRLAAAERSKLANAAAAKSAAPGRTKPMTKPKNVPPIVDRKIVPSLPAQFLKYANDDLAPSRKRAQGGATFGNMFN